MDRISNFRKFAGIGVLTATLFAIAPSANAQNDETKGRRNNTQDNDTKVRRNDDGGDDESRIGIKGGINLSNLYSGKNLNDQNGRWGLHAGVFFKLPVADLFAVQPEVLFTTAGNRFGGFSGITNPGGTGGNQTLFSLNYIQVPVLASLTAGPVSIQAGPYVSYLLNVKLKDVRVDNNGVPVSGGGGSNPGRELERTDFSTIDYGLAGGLALDVKGFQLGVRYNLGLREIGQGGASSFVTAGAKNSVAQLYIAFGL